MFNFQNGFEMYKNRKNELELDRLKRDYFTQLLDRCKIMFHYDNVPDGFSIDEFERMLILCGFCTVAKVKSNDNKLTAIPFSYLTGVSAYDDFFPNVGFVNPLWNSQEYKNGVDCVVVKNTHSYYDFVTTLDKYATILADIDISLDMTIVNTRIPFALSVMNNAQKESAENFYAKLRSGSYAVFDGSDLMQKYEQFQLEHPNNSNITNLITAKMNTFRMFYKDIGVSMTKDKTQAVLSDESDTDSQHLDVSLHTLLESRRKGIDEINAMFGTEIKVSINPIFRHIVENDVENISRETLEREVDDNVEESDIK